MAKKNPKNLERRELVEKMRQDQARKERARSLGILGVCVLIVVALIGAASWSAWQDHQDQKELEGTPIADLGVAKAAASCDPVKTTPTDKNQRHVDNQPITYGDAPPSFGAHRSNAAPFGRPFYDEGDRPEVPILVHNMEHGYTIAWYDATAAADKAQMDTLEEIAEKFADSDRNRFVAAPWTGTDGGTFPEGKHIALTRWTADPKDPANEDKQEGNWLYCGAVSGEAISDFVDQFPDEASPEDIKVG